MKKISIVIPALYEHENVSNLFKKLDIIIKKNNQYFFDVLLVDGIELQEDTKLLCDEFSYKYLNRVSYEFFGDAIRTGFKNVEGDSSWVVVLDADGSHDPEFIDNFIIAAEQDPELDVIIASRYIPGGSTDNNIFLIYLSKIVNIIYRVFFNLMIYDVSNNFRMYKYSRLKNLELYENNFEVVEEILIKLFHNFENLKVLEIPFRFQKRISGKSRRKLLPFAITFVSSILRLKKYGK